MSKAPAESIAATTSYLQELGKSRVDIQTVGKPGHRTISIDTIDTKVIMGEVIARLAALGYVYYYGMDEEAKTFSRIKP